MKRIVKKSKWAELLKANFEPFYGQRFFGKSETELKCEILGLFIETCIEDIIRQSKIKGLK